MYIKIPAAKSNLYLRVISQLVGIFGLVVLFYGLLYPQNQTHPVNPILIITLILLVVAANIWNFIGLLYFPVGVNIDTNAKLVEVKYLILKSNTLPVKTIVSYSSTKIDRQYNGILIHLNSGEKILLSNWNLSGYEPIPPFLDDSGIENLGEEKFGLFAYYGQYFNKK